MAYGDFFWNNQVWTSQEHLHFNEVLASLSRLYVYKLDLKSSEYLLAAPTDIKLLQQSAALLGSIYDYAFPFATHDEITVFEYAISAFMA